MSDETQAPFRPHRDIDLERELAGDLGKMRDRIRDAIVGGMHAAIEAEEANRGTGAVPVDGLRTNKVLLIDGSRGSGKTTLLLHVVRALAQHEHVVVARMLDLDSLPGSTNLLAHFVACLGGLRFRLDGRDADHELDGAWRELAQVVGMSWPGNLHARRAHIDPIEMAIELEDIERKRLELADRLRAFMRALVGRWPKSSAGRPLFVIAIDDADMRIERVCELLEAVRLFWHPNLCFLLAGDHHLFDAAVQRAKLGALRTVCPKEALSDVHHRLARDIASEVVSKAVPASHRFYVRERQPQERWEETTIALEAEGRVLSAEIGRTLAFDGEVAAGLPPHFRELSQLSSVVARATPGRVVSSEDFARETWVFAARSTGHPSDVLDQVLRGELYLYYHEYRYLPRTRVSVAMVTRPQLVRVADQQTLVGGEGRLSRALGLHSVSSQVGSLAVHTFGRSRGARGIHGIISVDVAVHARWDRNRSQSVEWLANSSLRDAIRAWSAFVALGSRSIADLARALILARLVPRLTDSGAPELREAWRRFWPPKALRATQLDYRELLHLTAPECGLPPADANELFQELIPWIESQRILDETVRQYVEGYRAERARNSLEAADLDPGLAHDWLRRIDDGIGRDYDFVRRFRVGEPIAVRSDTFIRLQNWREQSAGSSFERPPTLRREWGARGLHAYLPEARLRWVAREISEDQLVNLEASAIDMPTGVGMLPLQIQRLWARVGAPVARSGSGGFLLRFGADGRIIVTQSGVSPPVLTRGPSSLSVEGASGVVRLSTVGWEWTGPLAQCRVDQKLIWMLAWDFAADQGHVGRSGDPVLFPGLRVALKTPLTGSTGWMYPSWPALIDDESFAGDWERMFAGIERIHGLLVEQEDLEESDRATALVDIIAVWYVGAILSTAMSRQPGRQIELTSVVEQIEHLPFDNVPDPLWTVDDSRARAFCEYVDLGLPLLCAPESGMSDRAAAALWKKWRAAVARRKRPIRTSEIRAARERLHASEARGILPEIDQQRPQFKRLLESTE